MSATVIIPAAGSGKRFGADTPKQYLHLNGIPVFVRTLQIFEQTPEVSRVVLAASAEFSGAIRQCRHKYGLHKIGAIVHGGAERQDSIWNALQEPMIKQSDIILVHDVVRPFITPEFIATLITAAHRYGAVVPGKTPKETVKRIGADGKVDKTYPREQLRLIQTPQVFQREILLEAYKHAFATDYQGTDDASLVEHAGFPVQVIEGLESNLKITTRDDWLLAEIILQQQSP